MSSYVQYDGSGNQYVYFERADGSGPIVLQFDYWCPSSDASGVCCLINTTYQGLIRKGKTTAAGANIWVDGVALDPSVTRDGLYALLHNGAWHTVKVTAGTKLNAGQQAVFGSWPGSAFYTGAIRARNFKVKIGTQAHADDWDYESELGDSNGLFQNNVTVVRASSQLRGGFQVMAGGFQ